MIFESIEAKVRAALLPTHFELENESHMHHRGGDETHFRLIVVSSHFEGVPRVDRQRKVYALLEQERAQGLHALAMWTYTTSEWAKHAASADLASPDCASGTTPKV